jgi:metal-sulfur cluster biosynthetic enzyme
MSTENYKPAHWSIDKTHPQYHDRLVEALNTVTDPELGYSILQLGLVREVAIEDEKAHLVMILTTPFCPYGPSLLESARAATEDALGLKTSIEFGTQVWELSFMDPELRDSEWGMLI